MPLVSGRVILPAFLGVWSRLGESNFGWSNDTTLGRWLITNKKRPKWMIPEFGLGDFSE